MARSDSPFNDERREKHPVKIVDKRAATVAEAIANSKAPVRKAK